jgi:multidrug transporter EmrE-like cation transporter
MADDFGMRRPILCLACAIVFEVLWAVLLKAGRGPTVSWPNALMGAAYGLSLAFLNAACKRLDLSLAYAVWTGSGATLVALIGVLIFHEPIGLARGVGFVMVIVGVVVLIGFEPRVT